ncbi:TPA: hypothetical protein QDA74_006208 [Burkholderia territorii]|uniref:hypothetical protein n=1 Tax=Burkholderia territorii TaxID=1503055 RepID=UPI0011C8E37D|nr:hypothetical protein [Burkholderia territorii]TXG05773.1 hypothetical protein FU139_26195 [Burkholderia territorii]HDR8858146.1 hypothetical protein [Burkholderia territorii]HDR8864802.1 hypothetical protein [Burkholderia territorii]HDR8870120.1 hypothetical protein [Burkholderia territorii]HDR8874447.1 hypothetical protein [Burkholderia territorii]
MTFAKVMAVNYIGWDALRSLIAIRSNKSDLIVNGLIFGYWVDIEKYAALLREPLDLVNAGFLDRLGFPRLSAYDLGIRHCPECVELDYHCSLFDIQALSHCPWHGVPLTAPCRRCYQIVRTIVKHADKGKLICPACRVKLIDLTCPFARSGMNAEKLHEASERCSEFTNWWRGVCVEVPHANELLGSALCKQDIETERLENVELRRGCLKSVSEPPATWSCGEKAIKGEIIAWESDVEDNVGGDGEYLMRSCYRSVRRKIFRTFVRAHRSCLAELTSLSRLDWMYLERDYVCAVCVAYLTWRHVNEGGINSRVDRYQSVSRKELKNLPLSGASVSSRDLVNLLYIDYLRLLMNLDDMSRNVKIFAKSRVSETLVDFEASRVIPLSSIFIEPFETAGTKPKGVFMVTVPDGQVLLDRASERCKRRRRDREDMTGIDRPYIGFEVRNAWRDIEYNEILFKIKCFRRFSPKSYQCLTA